jgi:hypothetical protein
VTINEGTTPILLNHYSMPIINKNNIISVSGIGKKNNPDSRRLKKKMIQYLVTFQNNYKDKGVVVAKFQFYWGHLQ